MISKKTKIDNHDIDIEIIGNTGVVYFSYNNNYAITNFFYDIELKKFVSFDYYKPTQRQLNYIEQHILKLSKQLI